MKRNGFTEVSRNLASYKNNLLSHQNNYVKYLNIDDSGSKSFNILATNFSILHNFTINNEIMAIRVSAGDGVQINKVDKICL